MLLMIIIIIITLFADISPEKTWEAIYCSADLYSLYDSIEYSVSEDSVYWFCTPKCTKFDFGWDSAPLGSLQRSPRSPSWI